MLILNKMNISKAVCLNIIQLYTFPYLSMTPIILCVIEFGQGGIVKVNYFTSSFPERSFDIQE